MIGLPRKRSLSLRRHQGSRVPQNVLSTSSIEICEVTVSSVSCHHGVPSKAPKAAVLSTTKEICELTVSIVSCHRAASNVPHLFPLEPCNTCSVGNAVARVTAFVTVYLTATTPEPRRDAPLFAPARPAVQFRRAGVLCRRSGCCTGGGAALRRPFLVEGARFHRRRSEAACRERRRSKQWRRYISPK